MRYFVPTRAKPVYKAYNGSLVPYYHCKGTEDYGPHGNYAGYLAATKDMVEVVDPNYFWCTKDRVFNDCVHSKIVDSDGKTLSVPTQDSDGLTYLDSFMESGGFSQFLHDDYYMWGVGSIYKSFGSWMYKVNIDRANNQTRSNWNISIQVAFRRDNGDVLWYGNQITSTKVALMEIRIKGSLITDIYNVSQHLEYTSHQVRYNPYNLDTSFMMSGIISLYNNIRYERHRGSWYISDCHVFEDILHIAESFATHVIYPAVVRALWGGLAKKNISDITVEPITLPPAESNFLFYENYVVRDHVDFMAVGGTKDFSQYWWNVLQQNAYLDALHNVPKLNDNSISNILEIVGFIKALVVDHKIDIPKSLADAWLSYRYQYTTGKLDAKEAIDFVHRHRSLGSLDKWISCYGAYRVDFKGSTITCRCGLDIRPKELATLQKIWRGLYTYGLQPNFYVIWDMIPYSFIVDWFLPVGKLAGLLDAESQYSSVNYEIKNIIFSYSYDVTEEHGLYKAHQYTRFLSPGVVTLNGLYFFEEDPVSTKVVGYRALDALSLTLGRRK